MLVDANRAGQKMIKKSLKEIRKMHQLELHPKRFKKEYSNLFRESIKNNDIVEELLLIDKNGKETITDVNPSTFRINGTPYVQGVFRDTTKEHETIKKLTESKEEYKALFDNMANGFALHKIVTNKKGKPIDYVFLAANNAFERLTGLKSKKIAGKKVTKVLPGIEKDPVDWIGKYGKVALTGKAIVFENYSKQLNKWYSISAYSPEKGIFAVVFEDITKRRESEDKLIHSEKRFRDISLSMVDWIWEVDKNGKYTFVSAGVKRVLGYEPKEILGKTPFDFMSKEDKKRIASIFAKIVSQKKPIVDLENWNITKSGKKILFLTNGVPILDGNGKLVGYRGVDKDITERKQVENEMQKLASITKYSHELINMSTLDGKMVLLNKAGIKMLGINKEDISKHTILEVIPKHLMPVVKKYLLPTLMKGGVWQGDLQYTNLKTGKLTDVHAMTFVIKDSNTGKPKYFANISHDITERKRVENKIQESEERHRVIYESSLDAIMTLEPPTWKFTAGNKGTIKMFGAKNEKDFISRAPWNYSPTKQPDGQLSSAKAKKMIGLAMKKGYNFFEWTHKTIDGKEFFASVLLVKVKIGDKEFLQATVRNITELKLATQKIEQERDRAFKDKEHISTIVENIGDGVFVIDKNYKITLINKVACALSGYSKEESIGKNYGDVLKFVYEKTKKVNNEFIKTAIIKGKIAEMHNHTMIVRKDGQKIPVADSAAPVMDSKGNIVGCVVVFRDVEKERRVDRLKTEFVSVASHQLRTPLTGMKWFLEILESEKAGKLNAKQKDFINQIDTSNERMIALVSDLLSVSRIETGKKFDIVKRNINISSVVNSVLQDVKEISKERGVKVIGCGSGSSKKLIVRADADHIRQVFNNLISNAIKYSKRGGVVELGCKHTNGDVEFFVKDSGLGIPINQQKRVFDKFFRADNIITKETSGTGLGLYIAKAIVVGHGGRIWFKSSENRGTTFYFSIPRK